MSNQRYTPEFKDEAARQIVDRGYSVADVSERLGVSAHSLYKWVKAIKPDKTEEQAAALIEAKSEVLKLRARLRRTEEERDIDGVDISPFLLGEEEKSGREGFIVYMGNDIFGVKWRNWKLHFKEQTGWNGVLREYTMPRAYNLMADPQERDNVLFPHTWLPKAALPQLEEHVSSLRQYPPVPTGAADPYKPTD